MEENNSTVTLEVTINAPVEKCWECWANPAHILQFNKPFKNWHTAKVDLDFSVGGRLYYRMEEIDGREGFDFGGTYDQIVTNQLIEYTGDDGRKAVNRFISKGDATLLTETFEPEKSTPLDLQKEFIQTILDNFKIYVEQH